MKNIFHILLPLMFLSAPSLAAAQQTFQHQEPVYQDDITMQLTAENWLSSNSAQVHVRILASFSEDKSANIRAKMMKTLKKISPKADWRFTSFNRTQGSAGLEQWVVNAQTRLATNMIDGIRAKMTSVSVPGYKVKLQGINYRPTEAEKSANFILLRKDIYTQAKAELDMLNRLFPKRGYRITRIDFSPSALRYQRSNTLQQAKVESFQVSRDESSSNMPVSNKTRLHASVVISANHLPAR